MSEKKNYLTKEWYEKLASELHDLKSSQLPQVLERIAEARAMWDLSENFEYKSALEDKDLIDSRIAEIEELIKDVEIIEEETSRKKTATARVVDYGSKVSVEMEDGKQYEVVIVGTGEVSIEDTVLKVSLDSPLGLAIRGKKNGEIGTMRLENGRQKVKVISVK